MIQKEEIKRAIEVAMRKCPETGKPHFRYVHLWDIVYYLKIPLDKASIENLLTMIRSDGEFVVEPSFDGHLLSTNEEWSLHLQNMRCGLHERSLAGIWKVIKFFRENGIRNYLVGLKKNHYEGY